MSQELVERLTGYHPHEPPFSSFFGPRPLGRIVHDGMVAQWKQVCREVGKANMVPELHASRDEYFRVLDAYFHVLKGQLLLRREQDDFPEWGRLQHLFDEVQTLRTELSARWVSLDDLYQIVAEHLSPSAAELAAFAVKCPPPQAWYDDDFDPSTPAD